MAGVDHEQLNILVVDDDEAMRNLLVHIISRREHQVVTAGSAEAGLELLPHYTFQLAFLDHNLPGMEGLLLGEYLRRNNPDMTIAMVTGSEDLRLQRRSRDLALTFIGKPFHLEDILRVVDDCVAAARDRDSNRLALADPDHGPPFSRYFADLTEVYGMPNVPGRIKSRLVDALKRSLSNLRSAARYTERDRVTALSGLLTARVLGVDLPRTSSGLTLFEEYDRLMRERGRRTEFDGSDRASHPPDASG